MRKEYSRNEKIALYGSAKLISEAESENPMQFSPNASMTRAMLVKAKRHAQRSRLCYTGCWK